MTRKPLAAVAGLALLASCTQAQLDQAAAYQAQIAGACAIAMTLAPIAGKDIAPYIIGACSTYDAVSRLALDPKSLQWLADVIRKAKVDRYAHWQP